MTEKLCKVENELGLHARPCSILVQISNKFRSDIRIIRDDFEVNGKSIMGVMTLAAEQGTELIVRATGVDEEYAIREICNLFETKFGED